MDVELMNLFLAGLEFLVMGLEEVEVKHLVICMDNLITQLKECQPSWWNNPPPLKQHCDMINEKDFTQTEAVGGSGAIPLAVEVGSEIIEAPIMKDGVGQANHCICNTINGLMDQEEDCTFDVLFMALKEKSEGTYSVRPLYYQINSLPNFQREVLISKVELQKLLLVNIPKQIPSSFRPGSPTIELIKLNFEGSTIL